MTWDLHVERECKVFFVSRRIKARILVIRPCVNLTCSSSGRVSLTKYECNHLGVEHSIRLADLCHTCNVALNGRDRTSALVVHCRRGRSYR